MIRESRPRARVAVRRDLHPPPRRPRTGRRAEQRWPGVGAATSNRRLTGDPSSTAAHAIDGDPSTAWTSPFSDVVGSRSQIPLDPTVPTSSRRVTQPLDQRAQHRSPVSGVGSAASDHTVAVPPPDASGHEHDHVPRRDRRVAGVDDRPHRATDDRRPPLRRDDGASRRDQRDRRGRPSLRRRPSAAAPVCRTDLVALDGQPLAIWAVDSRSRAARR